MVLKALITVGIWVLGFICVRIMKKIQPGNRLYRIWVIFISLLFTIFALCEGFC